MILIRQQNLQWHQWRCSGILISETLHLSFGMEIQSAWKLASKSFSFLKPCLALLWGSRSWGFQDIWLSQSSVTVKIGMSPLCNPFGKWLTDFDRMPYSIFLSFFFFCPCTFWILGFHCRQHSINILYTPRKWMHRWSLSSPNKGPRSALEASTLCSFVAAAVLK